MYFIKLAINFIFLDSFDVYVGSNLEEVSLVDLNPLTDCNCSGLFNFAELQEIAFCQNCEIIFKCIEKNEDTIIGMCEKNFLPIDLLSSGLDINKIDFKNFLQ